MELWVLSWFSLQQKKLWFLGQNKILAVTNLENRVYTSVFGGINHPLTDVPVIIPHHKGQMHNYTPRLSRSHPAAHLKRKLLFLLWIRIVCFNWKLTSEKIERKLIYTLYFQNYLERNPNHHHKAKALPVHSRPYWQRKTYTKYEIHPSLSVNVSIIDIIFVVNPLCTHSKEKYFYFQIT